MLNVKATSWNESGAENLKAGHELNDAEIIFPKIEDEIIDKQIDKLKGAKMNEVTNNDNLITFDEFMKVQLEVAEVISAERVEKSEKLLKLKIALENEERQIVAGIAKSYAPEDLVGKKVIVVANLKPAKLMGLESKGMILALETEPGKHEVLKVSSNVKIGTRAK
jgi:methionyl-tRNA synthetase